MSISLGSTDDSDPIPKEEIERAFSKRDKATLNGVLSELDIVKQKMEHCYEKLHRMTQLYMTLQNQFQQFEIQRIKELQLRVNHGPTVKEDGTND